AAFGGIFRRLGRISSPLVFSAAHLDQHHQQRPDDQGAQHSGQHRRHADGSAADRGRRGGRGGGRLPGQHLLGAVQRRGGAFRHDLYPLTVRVGGEVGGRGRGAAGGLAGLGCRGLAGRLRSAGVRRGGRVGRVGRRGGIGWRGGGRDRGRIGGL